MIEQLRPRTHAGRALVDDLRAKYDQGHSEPFDEIVRSIEVEVLEDFRSWIGEHWRGVTLAQIELELLRRVLKE